MQKKGTPARMASWCPLLTIGYAAKGSGIRAELAARILKWIYATGPRARGFAIKGSEVEIFTRNFSL